MVVGGIQADHSTAQVPLCRVRQAITHKGSARQGLETVFNLKSIRVRGGGQSDSFSPSHD